MLSDFDFDFSEMKAARVDLHGHAGETTEPFETSVRRVSALRDPNGDHVWPHQAKRA